MKYSFEARFELARRLSATFQRSASNRSIPIRWSAAIPSQPSRTLRYYFSVRQPFAPRHLRGCSSETPRPGLGKPSTTTHRKGVQAIFRAASRACFHPGETRPRGGTKGATRAGPSDSVTPPSTHARGVSNAASGRLTGGDPIKPLEIRVSGKCRPRRLQSV